MKKGYQISGIPQEKQTGNLPGVKMWYPSGKQKNDLKGRASVLKGLPRVKDTESALFWSRETAWLLLVSWTQRRALGLWEEDNCQLVPESQRGAYMGLLYSFLLLCSRVPQNEHLNQHPCIRVQFSRIKASAQKSVRPELLPHWRLQVAFQVHWLLLEFCFLQSRDGGSWCLTADCETVSAPWDCFYSLATWPLHLRDHKQRITIVLTPSSTSNLSCREGHVTLWKVHLIKPGPTVGSLF